MILLILMAIVIAIEMIYLAYRKKRRKEEMSLFRKNTRPVEPLADKAHNTILTTEGISSTLARQGLDTAEADELISQAKSKLAMRDYSMAIERAEAAKLVLLRLKREAGSKPGKMSRNSDPGMRPMNESLFDPPDIEEQPREERKLDALPTNYLQAKFMLSTTKDLLEKKDVGSGEAFDFYTKAIKSFDAQDYTKALSYAIKAERILDSGTLTLIGEEKTVQVEEVTEVMACPACDGEVGGEDVFCRSCGQSLETTVECPGCGIEIESADSFCRKCGKKLK